MNSELSFDFATRAASLADVGPSNVHPAHQPQITFDIAQGLTEGGQKILPSPAPRGGRSSFPKDIPYRPRVSEPLPESLPPTLMKFAGGLASAVYGRRAVLDAEHASPTQPLPAPAPALSNAPENGKPTAPLEKIDPPQGDVFGNFGNSSEGGALEAGASRLPGAATQPPIQSREGPRGGSKGAGRLTETGSVGPGGGGEDARLPLDLRASSSRLRDYVQHCGTKRKAQFLDILATEDDEGRKKAAQLLQYRAYWLRAEELHEAKRAKRIGAADLIASTGGLAPAVKPWMLRLRAKADAFERSALQSGRASAAHLFTARGTPQALDARLPPSSAGGWAAGESIRGEVPKLEIPSLGRIRAVRRMWEAAAMRRALQDRRPREALKLPAAPAPVPPREAPGSSGDEKPSEAAENRLGSGSGSEPPSDDDLMDESMGTGTATATATATASEREGEGDEMTTRPPGASPRPLSPAPAPLDGISAHPSAESEREGSPAGHITHPAAAAGTTAAAAAVTATKRSEEEEEEEADCASPRPAPRGLNKGTSPSGDLEGEGPVKARMSPPGRAAESLQRENGEGSAGKWLRHPLSALKAPREGGSLGGVIVTPLKGMMQAAAEAEGQGDERA